MRDRPNPKSGKKLEEIKKALQAKRKPFIGPNNEVLYIDETRYSDNGRLALHIYCKTGPYAVLTVNLDPVKMAILEPGEIMVKAWSENSMLVPYALASPYFTDTGKRVPTGFVEAQVWTYNPNAMADIGRQETAHDTQTGNSPG